jgi:hypothetical protein
LTSPGANFATTQGRQGLCGPAGKLACAVQVQVAKHEGLAYDGALNYYTSSYVCFLAACKSGRTVITISLKLLEDNQVVVDD